MLTEALVLSAAFSATFGIAMAFIWYLHRNHTVFGQWTDDDPYGDDE